MGLKSSNANEFLDDSEKKLLKGKRFFIEFEHENKGIFGRYVVEIISKKQTCTLHHSFMSVTESGDIAREFQRESSDFIFTSL